MRTLQSQRVNESETEQVSLINILKGRAKVRGGGRKAVTTVTNLKLLIFILYINAL